MKTNQKAAGFASKPIITERAVCALVSRISGIPISADVRDGEPTSLPLSQVIMVFGVMFKAGFQKLDEWTRIALYSLDPTGPKLMYAVNAPQRIPAFKDSVFTRNSGACEVAGVNWGLGALCSQKPAGVYNFRRDVKVPEKSRTHFGAPRTWQSCTQMFDDYVEGEAIESFKLFAPSIFPLITIEAALSYVSNKREELGQVGTVHTMTRPELRNHIRNSINLALSCAKASPGSDSQSKLAEFRTHIIQQTGYRFNQIRVHQNGDTYARIRSAHDSRSLGVDSPIPVGNAWEGVKRSIDNWIDDLAKTLPYGLSGPGIVCDGKVLNRIVANVQQAFRLYLNMEDDQVTEMVIPTIDSRGRRVESPLATEAFRDPMFHAVCVSPIQVATGVSIPGDTRLPDDGNQLFVR